VTKLSTGQTGIHISTGGRKDIFLFYKRLKLSLGITLTFMGPCIENIFQNIYICISNKMHL